MPLLKQGALLYRRPIEGITSDEGDTLSKTVVLHLVEYGGSTTNGDGAVMDLALRKQIRFCIPCRLFVIS